MSTTYRWKPAAHVRIDPQVAGEELERIRVRHNGRLESDMVVAAAREATNPLHDHFEWDDEAAAEKYRAEQAGYLIRSIEVIVSKNADDERTIRAFVSVVQEEDRSYTSIAHALSNDDMRNQVVASALRELEAWEKRHAELVELARVFSAIREARSAIEGT